MNKKSYRIMTTEEKAKAYDEALERAKQVRKYSSDLAEIKRMEDIFPELAENEDERILEIIKHCIGSRYLHTSTIKGISQKECLAWLEKQGETYTKKDVDDAYLKGVCDTKQELEKQGEQKLADKVEPKFKVGDWVIRSAEGFKHNTYLVTEVKDYYVCKDLKGRRGTFTFNDVHKNFKLWDISDAKDGDVLASNNSVFIFQEEYIAEKPIAYCGLMNGLFVEGEDACWTNEKCYPATKEQRDTLMKAITDAGYEWDIDKKELKKIEQKPVIDIDIPFGAKDSELIEASYYIPEGFHAEIEGNNVVIKKGEQNPAWSEDDETGWTNTMIMIKECASNHYTKDSIKLVIDWLKSLKERIGE